MYFLGLHQTRARNTPIRKPKVFFFLHFHTTAKNIDFRSAAGSVSKVSEMVDKSRALYVGGTYGDEQRPRYRWNIIVSTVISIMKNIVSVEMRGSGRQLTNTKVLYFAHGSQCTFWKRKNLKADPNVWKFSMLCIPAFHSYIHSFILTLLFLSPYSL